MKNLRPVKPAVYEQTFPVPVVRVWRALTEPEQIVKWWGEDAMYRMTDIQHELRPGAAVLYAGKFVEGVQGGRKFAATGTCVEVKPLRSLVYTRLYADSLPIAEELCDRIGIIHNGRLVFVDTQEKLQVYKQQYDGGLESVFLEMTK